MPVRMKFLIVVPVTFISSVLMGQSGFVVTGGENAGTGGTVSFSTGLPDFLFKYAGSGSVEEGLQHPWTTQNTALHEPAGGIVRIKVHPNPAETFLQISLEEGDPERFSVRLLDNTGRTILEKKITRAKTELSIASCPAALYLLQVYYSGTLVKSSKIAKIQ